jgi:hypothetical protein
MSFYPCMVVGGGRGEAVSDIITCIVMLHWSEHLSTFVD